MKRKKKTQDFKIETIAEKKARFYKNCRNLDIVLFFIFFLFWDTLFAFMSVYKLNQLNKLVYFLQHHANALVVPKTLLQSLVFSIACILVCILSQYRQRNHITHDQSTIEGSAKWSSLGDFNDNFADESSQQELLSANTQISYDVERFDGNTNCLIMGFPGSGKTFNFVSPNLAEMTCAYIVTDPKGSTLSAMGEMLKANGYNIRIFDTITLNNCNTYNPLKYCYDETDVRKIVRSFIDNALGQEKKAASNDPYWDDSAVAFMCATIALLLQYGKDPEIMGGYVFEPTFSNVAELIRMCGEPDPDKAQQSNQNMFGLMNSGGGADGTAPRDSMLGSIFERVREQFDNRADYPYCLKTWDEFKDTPEKTMNQVRSCISVKVNMFNIAQVSRLTNYDTIDLDTFGLGKDALFILKPTADDSYSFLINFLYIQLFDVMYRRGNSDKGSYALYFKNHDLIRYYSQAKYNEHDRELDFEAIRKSYIQETKDGYYDIIDANGNWVSRRPTIEEAKRYIKATENATIEFVKDVRTPIHVTAFLDEFKAIGKIPKFEDILATCRGYNISCNVIVQDSNQLEEMYEKSWQTVDGNCSFFMCIGAKDNNTCEYVSKKLGDTTVWGFSANEDKTGTDTHGFQSKSRPLLKPDEVAAKSRQAIIVAPNGIRICDEKYSFVNHPRFKESAYYTKKYFDTADNYPIHDVKTITEVVNPNELHIQPLTEEIASTLFISTSDLYSQDVDFDASNFSYEDYDSLDDE